MKKGKLRRPSRNSWRLLINYSKFTNLQHARTAVPGSRFLKVLCHQRIHIEYSSPICSYKIQLWIQTYQSLLRQGKVNFSFVLKNGPGRIFDRPKIGSNTSLTRNRSIALLTRNWRTIGWMNHLRVPLGFCIKTRLSAQPLIWKLCFILMQIKLFFTRIIFKVRVELESDLF